MKIAVLFAEDEQTLVFVGSREVFLPIGGAAELHKATFEYGATSDQYMQ